MPAEPSTAHESRRKGTEPCIRLAVPLPPPALRGNARAHWSERKRAADEYSRNVFVVYCDAANRLAAGERAYTAAAVEYDWHYAGARPDLDNVARSIKVLQDTLCCSLKADALPHDGKPYYINRYFLGLIEDDGGIEPVTFKRTKVAHKADECVVVTIWPARSDGGT